LAKTGTRAALARSEIAPPLDLHHPDYQTLSEIADGLCEAAGGSANLGTMIGEIIRTSIDRVVQTPKTSRLFYDHLEPTEKTYIGTCVEIELRSQLRLPKGPHMDLLVAGHDTDVKFSRLFGGWMIPEEAYGKACILISADDATSRFSAGIIVAKNEYLRHGKNKDKKLGVAAAARSNILWLFRDEPYPRNFWLDVATGTIARIASARSGNERMATFVREVLDRPFSRKIVEDVGAQDDFMRRIRADNGSRNGTRDVLLSEGIVVVHGHRKATRALLKKFGFELPKDMFMSHALKPDEYAIARSAGYKV
jgi:hypothetical protein